MSPLALPLVAALQLLCAGAYASGIHIHTTEGTGDEKAVEPPRSHAPAAAPKDGLPPDDTLLTPEIVEQMVAALGDRVPSEQDRELVRRILMGAIVPDGDFKPATVGHVRQFADTYLNNRLKAEKLWREEIEPRRASGERIPSHVRQQMADLRNQMNAAMKGPLARSELHNEIMKHDPFSRRAMTIPDFARDEPRNPVARTQLGLEYLQQGRAADALAAAKQAVELGGRGDAYALRAAANSQLGNYADAVADARRALDFNPDDKQAMAALRLSEGRASYGGGAGSGSSGYTPQSGASDAYGRGFLGGGAGGGAAAFGTASRNPGAAAAARFNDQARSALTMGDGRAALEAASRALAADPQNPLAYYLRAAAYRGLGNWRAAAEDAAKGLALSPKNSALLAVYGQALNRTKDYKGALAAANLALEVNPRDAWAFANRGYALGALGDREAMLADLRRAAELDPAFQKSLEQALQAPTDADLLFLFPGEAAPGARGAMAAAGRGRRFGVLAGAAGVGGLLLALGLLSAFAAPLKERVTSVFTRMTRRGPAVTSDATVEVSAGAGLLRGQYELGKQIGAGGMGLVFEGTDRSLGRRVAVKRMRDEIRLDPRERARFVAEAKTVAGLHHPHIVDIYAIVEDADDLHLVFEFVEGRTVHELVQGKGRFAPAEAARVVRGAADALDFAHSRGVIHRDMKPSNLMLDGSGRVKVMDFGIARAAKDAMTRYSMTNTVVGTPPYMAPEQEQGQVRKESDVYALAVCAYELLCGRLPFPGVGAGMLMNKINMSYVPPAKMVETLPAALDGVFAQAFAPDPDKRCRTAGEFASALEAALAVPARA